MYKELYPITHYFYPLLPSDKAVLNDHDMQVLHQTFASQRTDKNGALLYLHIPFCQDVCKFCPFHVSVKHDDQVYQDYSDHLCKEMRLLSEQPYIQDMTFSAVYFGGGSPSLFPVQQLKQIFNAMHRFFNIEKEAEITFEGEPKTLGDPARLDLLKEFNVQRISFGLQTYDPKIRELFNIQATLDDIEQVRVQGKQRGFADINVDMMYDLPGQNSASLRHDMQRLLEDDYDSVDYYNLHYFAFSNKFKADMANGTIAAKPDQAMHLALTQDVFTFMGENGYHHVADQVFSKHSKVCDYFKLLWGGGYGEHRAETLAIGASARGYLDGVSYMNRANVNRYKTDIDSDLLPLEKASQRLIHAENRGAAFFLKFFRLDKTHQRALQIIPINLLQSWKEKGLVEESLRAITLTETGKLWITNMMVELFEPTQQNLATGAKEVLIEKPSRTGTF